MQNAVNIPAEYSPDLSEAEEEELLLDLEDPEAPDDRDEPQYSADRAEIFERHSPIAIAPAAHVRSPEMYRHASKLAMTFTACIGAAAGAHLILGENAPALKPLIADAVGSTFGAVFLRQAALGAIFLAAELVLGFFALGDLIVWLAPFLCASGAVMRVAATSPKLIPGTIITLGAVVLGAAYSADMSCLLLRMTGGGTIHMGSEPRRACAVEFAGCLAAVLLGSIINAAVIISK